MKNDPPADRYEAPAAPASAPGVTVLLAARNAGAFLAETLASLRAQTLPGFALVAVNDGSTDGTGDILAAHVAASPPERPVTLLTTEGIGLAAARNRALAAARAPFLLILDGDDVLPPDLAARAVAAMTEGCDLAYPLFEHVAADGAPLGVRSRPPRRGLGPARILTDNPIHSDSGVLVRAEALRAAGGFDAALSGCIGLDAWTRVLALRPGNAAALAGPAVLYRRSPGQITADPARMAANFARVLTKARDIVPPPALRHALAAQRLYWASLAYERGEAADARAYTAAAWRTAPGRMLRTPYAYARALVSMASLLPEPLHGRLRAAALGARRRGGGTKRA